MKKKNYRELKGSIRMMKSHRSNTEEKNLIEEGIDRIIKHNESN